MNKLILGATLALGLVVGAAGPSLASPGDGLDRNAAAQGNDRFGGMHRNARMESRALMHRAHRTRRHPRHHRHR